MYSLNVSNTELTADILTALENKIKTCISQLRLSKNSIVKCNWIAEIGAYTIGTDSNNKSTLERTYSPMQFSDESKKLIEQECTFTNHKGEPVFPTFFRYTDWYKKELRISLESRKLIISNMP